LDRSERAIKQQQVTVQQITKQNSLQNRMDKMRQLAARKQPNNKLYATNQLDRMSVSSGGSLSTSTSPVSLPSNDSTFQPIAQQTLFTANQHLQQQMQQTLSSTPNNFMFSNPSTVASNSSSLASTLLDNNNHQTQQTLASSLLPLYFASYLNAQNKYFNQTSNPLTSQSTATTTNAQSVDQMYLQNLLATIYTLTTYQQQQQQQQHSQLQAPDLAQLLLYQLTNLNNSNNNSNQTTNPLFNTNNIFNTYNNCTKLLNLNQLQQQTNDVNNNASLMSQPNMNSNNNFNQDCNLTVRKRTAESPKIIFEDPNIDIELKVEEHFRRSLGNNYVKLMN
jgi:hypothetical protein